MVAAKVVQRLLRDAQALAHSNPERRPLLPGEIANDAGVTWAAGLSVIASAACRVGYAMLLGIRSKRL
jgi:hypothetical protein